MKTMIHNLSKRTKSALAVLLAFVMVFGIVAVIAPVEAQALSINASDSGFYNVAYDEFGNTDFEAGAKIRVINQTRANYNKDKSDAVYQLGDWDNEVRTEDTWELATDDNYVVWNGTGSNTIYGVYPYNASYDEFTIPTNQEGGVQDADWMTATYTGARPASNSVDLNFSHLLTKVTVEVKTWNAEFPENNRTITEPKIWSKCAGVEVAYGTGSDGADVYTPEGSATGITPLKGGTTENPTFTAIVAPVKYGESDNFMTFNIGNEELTVFAGDNTLITDGLRPGCHYTFSLTVGKEAVTISSVNVIGWNYQNIEGGVATEVS